MFCLRTVAPSALDKYRGSFHALPPIARRTVLFQGRGQKCPLELWAPKRLKTQMLEQISRWSHWRLTSARTLGKSSFFCNAQGGRGYNGCNHREQLNRLDSTGSFIPLERAGHENLTAPHALPLAEFHSPAKTDSEPHLRPSALVFHERVVVLGHARDTPVHGSAGTLTSSVRYTPATQRHSQAASSAP